MNLLKNKKHTETRKETAPLKMKRGQKKLFALYTIGKPLRVDSVYDMFERMEKKTGIKITPHMLRRYYANTRWEADWPLEMISQALGHKHLDTTIRYLNVLDDKLKTASQEFYRRYSKLYGVEQFLESRR